MRKLFQEVEYVMHVKKAEYWSTKENLEYIKVIIQSKIFKYEHKLMVGRLNQRRTTAT